MTEYSIPIMFDVVAETRSEAARLLVDRLVKAALPGGTGVVSWWTLEAEDKAVDGNDNDAGIVVFTDHSSTRTVFVALAGPTLDAVDGEIDGMLDFLEVGGIVQHAAVVT